MLYEYAMSTHSNALVTVGVVGASGYAGRELLAVLSRHDGVRVALATSRSEAGEPSGFPGLCFGTGDPGDLAGLDVVFLGLPHGTTRPWVEGARQAGARVVDLTADHRPGSGCSDGAVYGLPERSNGELAGAALVANPGCYPTGVILAVAPLLERGLVDLARPIVVNAASGTTGAGRSPKRHLLFSEVAGDFHAYGLGNDHRHLREMRAALPGAQILFIPHLLPVPRGILETVALPTREGVTAAEVRSIWQEAYAPFPTVEVRPEGGPSLRDVVGTDRLVLSVTDNRELATPTITVVAALDNLGKGAAGQAVQNMNVMMGLEPTRGLRC